MCAWLRCDKGGGNPFKKTDIFKDGIYANLITGMTAYAIASSEESGISKYLPVYNIIDNKIDITAPVQTNVGLYGGSVLSSNSIDMTDIQSITFTVDSFTRAYSASEAIKLVVSSTNTNNFTATRKANVTATGDITIDVSSLTGNYYIGAILYSYNTTGKLIISQITYV